MQIEVIVMSCLIHTMIVCGLTELGVWVDFYHILTFGCLLWLCTVPILFSVSLVQGDHRSFEDQRKKYYFPYIFFSHLSLDIDAPVTLVTTEVTEDTATVTWDRVRAEIEGYMLSYESSEGTSPGIPVGRDSSSYRLIGLRPGVLHTVYIWAFKGDKVSKKTSTEAETGKLTEGLVKLIRQSY